LFNDGNTDLNFDKQNESGFVLIDLPICVQNIQQKEINKYYFLPILILIINPTRDIHTN